jgi:minor extracellular serine protease Vpr
VSSFLSPVLKSFAGEAAFGGSGDPAEYAANDPTQVEPGTFPTAKLAGGFDCAGER